MAAFHKPKVYRSSEGCCICKAKSSSSRFTASAKYASHFESCFRLPAPGSGEEEGRGDEICNACVLLVKRYRKLPAGSGRHWAHVVDARAGPGVKNFVKLRRRESCRERAREGDYAKKHVWRRRGAGGKAADTEDEWPTTSSPPTEPRISGFLDPLVWRRREMCCGPVFVSPWGEAVIDTSFLRLPCRHGLPRAKEPVSTISSTDPAATSTSTSTASSPTSLSPPSALLTIESIIESELQTFQQKPKAMEVVRRVDYVEDRGLRRTNSDPDWDEGFFDKPSISPVSSIEGGPGLPVA